MEPQLTQIRDVLQGKAYHSGTTLMTVEQPGEFVYFILSGTVKVHVEQLRLLRSNAVVVLIFTALIALIKNTPNSFVLLH